MKNEDGKVVQAVPMGTFRVDRAELVDDKDYKKVVAYDLIYDASVDVVGWYNQYFADGAKHTVKETRESLLAFMGIPFVEQTLPNDGVQLEKTIEATTMTGTSVLRQLCVINGGFGRMNRHGRFEVIGLTGLGLFPEDSLGEAGNTYPSETLYPEDYFEYLGLSDSENLCPEYRSVRYEEYMTMPITCLNIRSTSDDIGVTVGEDLSNPYVIASNFFLYGKTVEELEEIGRNILGRIEGITYRPNTTVLDGLPYLEVGDVFALEKNNDSVESYIFSRTLSGIQALKDTYEAKGNKVRTNEVDANEEILQLQGKILEIKKNAELFSLSLKNIGEDTASLLEMTASTVVLQVGKDGKVAAMALDASGDSVDFSLSADNIVFEGNKIDLSAKNLSIESENFTVDSEGHVAAKSLVISGGDIDLGDGVFSVDNKGHVTARAIDIEGGSINIQSALDSDNAIVLQHLDFEINDSIEISVYGKGEPADTGYKVGTYYLDVDSGTVYVLVSRPPARRYWETYRQLNYTKYTLSDVGMDPGKGFTVTEKTAARASGSGGGSSEDEKRMSSYGIDAEIGRDADVYGRLNVGGDLSAKGILLDGYRLVTSSVVVDYSSSSSILSRQYIPAPGITNEKPAYVCNGDVDAQPNLLVSRTGISSADESISFIIEGLDKDGLARYSYSYWIKEG